MIVIFLTNQIINSLFSNSKLIIGSDTSFLMHGHCPINYTKIKNKLR